MKKFSAGGKKLDLRNNKGFTLIELLIVMAIIGILASIAVPVFAEYKARAYDAHAKSELHNIFVACKAYWSDSGSASGCDVAAINNSDYGYTQTSNISVALSGNETAFSGAASNINTGNTFSVNAQGNIS